MTQPEFTSSVTARAARQRPWPRAARRAACTAVIAAMLVAGAQAADAPRAPVSATPAGAVKAPAASAPDASPDPSAQVAKAPAAGDPAPMTSSRYAPDRFTGRAGLYYGLIWGVDSISVRLVQAGELVRFSYRVVDPNRARVLNDKQAEARLEAPRVGVSLTVPTMEKVGQLRQTNAPEAGRSYWMTFSNKGRRVVRGDRVDVVIGQFRANNLVVD